MWLVAGATGFLGREICRRLAGRGRRVRGLTRRTSDPAALALLQQWGVEVAQGDLRDRSSLEAACRDVNVVISAASATRSHQAGDGIERTDYQGHLDLVHAARGAGVIHFVFGLLLRRPRWSGPSPR